MILIPERLLLALQDDGWIIRSKIRLVKTSAMPESMDDRCSNATEELYMLVKQGKYYYDNEVVKEPTGANLKNWWYWTPQPSTYEYCTSCDSYYDGIALRSVKTKTIDGQTVKVCPTCGEHDKWTSHYAAFPTWLPERCIKLATSLHGACIKCGAPWERVVEHKNNPSKGKNIGTDMSGGIFNTSNAQTSAGLHRNGGKANTGVPTNTLGWQATCECGTDKVIPCSVLDIFSGSGTTALTADRLGRHGIGIELNPHYYKLSKHRIQSDAPMIAAVEDAPVEKMAQTSFLEF
jgi:DNA modification methylase